MAYVIGNRIKVSTATTGTGTVTLSTTAEDGFQNFANGGIANTNVVRYTIEDGNDFEIGNGTYSSTGPTLTRTLLESSTGSLLNLSGDAIVFITAAAEDLQLKDSSGNISVSGNITVTGTVDGRDVATDGTKLDGIETGATADQTASEILTALLTVDGSGTSLDADLLDGQEGSYYLDAANLTGTIDADTLGGTSISNIFRTNTNEFTQSIFPAADATWNLGTVSNDQWQGVYAYNMYANTYYHNADRTDYMQYTAGTGLRFYFSSGEEFRMTEVGVLHCDSDIIAYSSTVSDERLKENIKPITGALEKVNQLNGYTFSYKKDGRESAGVIAQELEKVFPSAVQETETVFHGEEGELYKTVQYDQLHGLLIEAIKELKAEIEELKNDSPN